MNLITRPWIAVDIGTDRVHVALLDEDGEARSVLPTNGEFDTIFHVSRSGGEIRAGRSSLDFADDDPAGLVSLTSYPLKENSTIHFDDDRGLTNPTILFSVMLGHVRRFCERNFGGAEQLKNCVLALPHRSSALRRRYAKIAREAGFDEIHFRDSAVAAATVWKYVWGDSSDYVTVCNLGASQFALTLLRCRCGGCERVEEFHSFVGGGVDEIDRTILQAADPTIPWNSADGVAALRQIKAIRKQCSFDEPELFRFFLKGRKKRIRTVHFETGTRIFLQRLQHCFEMYAERSSQLTGRKDVPIILVGGGANNPMILEAVEKFGCKVYWWAEAEEATALGTAMMLQPKQRPSKPTAEQDRFFMCYERSVIGDVESQCRLAGLLDAGNGAPVAADEASDWYRLSAKNGCQEAKYELAKRLFQGRGASVEPEEAARLLEQSATEGYAPSQYSWAVYLNAVGSDRASEADLWMRRAADQGYADAVAYFNNRAKSTAPGGDMPNIGEWNFPGAVEIDD